MKIQSTPHRLPQSYTMVFIRYSKVLLKYHGIVSKSHRTCWFLEIQSIMEISLKCWTIRAEAALTASHCSCLTLLWRLNLLNSAIHPNPRVSESCQSSATHWLMPRDLMSATSNLPPLFIQTYTETTEQTPRAAHCQRVSGCASAFDLSLYLG